MENADMKRLGKACIAVAASVLITDLPTLSFAQITPGAAASTPKQMQKAQSKADRKAARARKNAELKALEKNGYQPGAVGN